jgi:hypothetical protein
MDNHPLSALKVGDWAIVEVPAVNPGSSVPGTSGGGWGRYSNAASIRHYATGGGPTGPWTGTLIENTVTIRSAPPTGTTVKVAIRCRMWAGWAFPKEIAPGTVLTVDAVYANQLLAIGAADPAS